jgi:hypothetical protein
MVLPVGPYVLPPTPIVPDINTGVQMQYPIARRERRPRVERRIHSKSRWRVCLIRVIIVRRSSWRGRRVCISIFRRCGRSGPCGWGGYIRHHRCGGLRSRRSRKRCRCQLCYSHIHRRKSRHNFILQRRKRRCKHLHLQVHKRIPYGFLHTVQSL